jgi:hypothetical protein
MLLTQRQRMPALHETLYSCVVSPRPFVGDRRDRKRQCVKAPSRERHLWGRNSRIKETPQNRSSIPTEYVAHEVGRFCRGNALSLEVSKRLSASGTKGHGTGADEPFVPLGLEMHLWDHSQCYDPQRPLTVLTQFRRSKSGQRAKP